MTIEERIIVNAAIRYTVSAVELYGKDKTLSMLASFTAIEAIVNIEYKGVEPETCKECSQPRYTVRKKFREFLMKYMGDTAALKNKFNALYDLRSDIVHTGRTFDKESLFGNINNEEFEKELIQRLEVLQIGKIAICNWITAHPYGVNKLSVLAKKILGE